MITKESIEKAANKFSDNYPSWNYKDEVAYAGFEAGVRWAMKQIQSESLTKKDNKQ